MQSEKYQLAGGVVLEAKEGELEVLGTSLRRAPNPIERDTVRLPRGTWLAMHHEQGVWHRFCGPDQVERAIAHAQAGYGWRTGRDKGELQFFISLQAQLRGAQGEVRRFRSLSPEEQQAFTARCRDVYEELRAARKPAKLRIAWRVYQASEGKDSLGRPNPNVSEYRIATAERDIESLVKEMREICDRVERRALTVRYEIVSREGEAELFHTQIGEAMRLADQNGGREEAMRLLEQIMRDMARVNDKPWRNLYRRCVTDDLVPAQIMIRENQPTSAFKYLHRARFAIELLTMQREFVELFYRISLHAGKRPRTDESKKKWLQQLAIHQLELKHLIESIPTSVKVAGNEHDIDKYLRGRTVSNFRGYCSAALVSLHCVEVYTEHRRYHLEEALAQLRLAEKCW